MLLTGNNKKMPSGISMMGCNIIVLDIAFSNRMHIITQYIKQVDRLYLDEKRMTLQIISSNRKLLVIHIFEEQAAKNIRSKNQQYSKMFKKR